MEMDQSKVKVEVYDINGLRGLVTFFFCFDFLHTKLLLKRDLL